MRALVFYAYPTESDGLSIQGDLLYKGLKEAGHDVFPCNPENSMQAEFYLKHLDLDVAFGIGYWANVPNLVHLPLKHGVTPVPWFNADGWVANYHKDLSNLGLMFTTSEWVKQTYERDGVDVKNMAALPIGIDTDLFRPMGRNSEILALRKMLGIKEDEIVILTAGGDVTSKGAQEMFYALAKINSEFKNWKYICKSWPSDCAEEWHAEESRIVEELGIGEKVVFIDAAFSNDFMPYLLNAIDIYAAPSRIEGFGMIQVEAMLCGKPVVSINAMGPKETIVHGKTGFLAKVASQVMLESEWVYPWMGFDSKKVIKFNEPKMFAVRADVDELAEYTLKLMKDAELRDRIGKQGREHAVKSFDYRVISKRAADIVREKLGL